MALYKLDETGEAKRVDVGEYMSWRSNLDETCFILARHVIIEHKQLGAVALDARGRYKGKVLAIIETRLCPNTLSDETPPWGTFRVDNGADEFLGSTWNRLDAMSAHIGKVNMVTQMLGGRVLIR